MYCAAGLSQYIECLFFFLVTASSTTKKIPAIGRDSATGHDDATEE
jgi:hypothetical protein